MKNIKTFESFLNEGGMKHTPAKALKRVGFIKYYKVLELLEKCAISEYKGDILRLINRVKDIMEQYNKGADTDLSILETLINIEITYKTPQEKFPLRLSITHNTCVLEDIEDDKVSYNVPKFLRKELLDASKWYLDYQKIFNNNDKKL
jgi:hypothetical protein